MTQKSVLLCRLSDLSWSHPGAHANLIFSLRQSSQLYTVQFRIFQCRVDVKLSHDMITIGTVNSNSQDTSGQPTSSLEMLEGVTKEAVGISPMTVHFVIVAALFLTVIILAFTETWLNNRRRKNWTLKSFYDSHATFQRRVRHNFRRRSAGILPSVSWRVENRVRMTIMMKPNASLFVWSAQNCDAQTCIYVGLHLYLWQIVNLHSAINMYA